LTTRCSSALYSGYIVHVRRRPRIHKFGYRLFSLLIDLDELEDLDRKLRWFSLDRFNLFSFYRQDRGDGSGRELRVQIEAAMAAASLVPDGGPIRLLTMPRVFGWSFNPLSIFFCYNRAGALTAILWEVDNTFGERHGYLIPADEIEDGTIRQICDKRLYVSPFMDMNLTYAFRVRPPGEKLSISIDVSDGDGVLFIARHAASRAELTDAGLVRAFIALPFLTLGVVAGIHWEALKLWFKGMKLRSRPPPPDAPLSIVSSICPQRKRLAR
jgi:uncharacterized protein